MSKGLWLPFLIGLSLLAVAIPIVGILQLESHHMRKITVPEEEPLLHVNVEAGKDDTKQLHSASNVFNTMKDKSKLLWKHISERRNFQILLSIFFIAAMASSSSPLFAQYISKRYHWTFANAGYLLSVKAAVNVLLIGLVIPITVKLLSSGFDFESGRINKLGAQVMLAVSVLGASLIAFSPTVSYLIFGS